MRQTTIHTASNNNSASCLYQYCYGYETYQSSSTARALYVEGSTPGYCYFGARYYESDLSVWLSVDPLASKYPTLSPYMYVRGNPVMLIDRWGLEGEPKSKNDGVYDCNSCDNKPSENLDYFKRDNNKRPNNYSPNPAHDFMRAANRQRFLNTSLNNNASTFNSVATSSTRSTRSTNKNTNGAIGHGINAGLGFSLGNLGYQVSIGFFGTPGSFGQAYISFGSPPRTAGNIDLSFSIQYLMGYSPIGSFDLFGSGKSIGIGALTFGGSYLTDNYNEPSYGIIGIGPSIGAKFTSSSINTQTFTLPVYIPILGGRVGGFILL